MKTGLYWRYVESMEKALIPVILKKHHGSVSAAARELGVNRATLRAIMKKLGIYEKPTLQESIKRSHANYGSRKPKPKMTGVDIDKVHKKRPKETKPLPPNNLAQLEARKKIEALQRPTAVYHQPTADLIRSLCK